MTHETKFETGDVVALQSMCALYPEPHDLKTVVAVGPKGVTCVWDAGGKPQRKTYPPEALKLIARA